MRKILSAIAALFMAFAGLVAETGSASADTPPFWVSHVYMNIGNTASQTQASQYTQLIGSLRAAAGHAWRDGVMQTQSSSDHSLIRLDLAQGNARIALWFTPDNLYLRGFTTTSGATFSFNDFNLQAAMQPATAYGNSDLLPAAATGGTYITLPFSSNYNNLVQVAGRDRAAMPISWNDFFNSFYNLAYADQGTPATNQAIARDLLFMIQYTSESARFNDVFGVMSDIMGNAARFYNGLPALQQEVENDWTQMSRYAINVSNGTNPAPLYVGPNAGNVSSFNDVQRFLALAMGTSGSTSPTGDWNHSEL
ncbi:hypothetical protein ABH920_003341 [Catenulispora sp. EB89]|uniref:ribosome-inactivating family protein n=1 Tax=Catenulispora sp. EB89 TaxID=3156257 RepID=UPI003516E211